jgi:acyl carrier protein
MGTNHRAIEATLIAYIREQCLSRNGQVELDDETNLFEAGIVDSAGLLSFICFIEEEYGLTVPDEDLLPENFVTIARIAGYIRAHLQVQPA